MPSTKKPLAIYPGTFDPITNGHIDIALRSLNIFDHLVIAIVNNPNKQALFSIQERLDLLQNSFADVHDRISFDTFDGLLVDFCRTKNISCIVRGLRAVADFEYEFQLAHMNKRIDPKIDTMFLMTDERNFYVSSSLIKEVAALHGDVEEFVPDHVNQALVRKFKP